MRDTYSTKEKLPKAIPQDFFITKKYLAVASNQGVMPEIINPANIIIGRKAKDKKDRVYFVDTHSVIIVGKKKLE